MSGFFIQEVILSSIYIVETVKIMRTAVHQNTRRLMSQLIVINALIIIMDLGLLGLECASLYILETIFKGFLYSVKLKLEFAILSKLVKFVGKSGSSTQRELSIPYLDNNELGPPGSIQEKSSSSSAGHPMHPEAVDVIDMTRVHSDLSYASTPKGRQSSIQRPGGVSEEEWDLAQFEHLDTLPSHNGRKSNGDIETAV